ncbi:MAG TPA: GNAT family N-acetyltransferase [Stellaceae bacterium]|nr:GNAT family N-acetyltransferase [Stellaceae bacterium]
MTQTIFPVIKLANGVRYEIDADKARLDLAIIHGFLVRSHWAKGIPLSIVERAIENSLVLGLYRDGRQIGFARIVSDRATFAYLADVFVLPPERGRRLGRWLVETALKHPELRGLRRWLLGTRDAQGLYAQCGFRAPAPPFAFMERLDAGVYDQAPPLPRRGRKPGRLLAASG